MTLKGVKFDESFEDKSLGSTVAYFIAPKDILKGRYSDAIHAEISVEFPTGHPEPECCSVALSPTRFEDGAYSDYDWTDISLTDKQIETLLNMIK